MRPQVLAFLLLILLAAPVGLAQAEGTLSLRFTVPRDKLFESSGAVTCTPPGGMIAIIGQLDYSRFSVDSVANIQVVAPNGQNIPITIDESSIYSEFERIVGVRFYFLVPEADARGDGVEGYKVTWGPEINSANNKVPTIVPDGAMKDSYREFIFYNRAGGGDGASVATIEVIADSNADYYFLLYLLPMVLLFTILTFRKLRANAKRA
ncbi:MAG: hypothetical protein WC712_09035 [Candidatus Brocadiia bacterium]